MGQQGRVFLSKEEERFAAYQVDSATNWTITTEGALTFKFRTHAKNGLLAFARGKGGQFQLWLQEGRLLGEYSFNGAAVFSFDQGKRLNTDSLISVLLSKTSTEFTIFVIGAPYDGPLMKVYNTSSEWDIDSPIYMGGLPSAYRAQLRFPNEQFVGCIQEVKVSNTVTPPGASSPLFEQRGTTLGNCVDFNACNSNNCSVPSQCRNRWTEFTCICGNPPDLYGPTCREYAAGEYSFQPTHYNCTDVNLLTEPAFTELEVITFSVQDFFIENPKVILHLTSPDNPVVSLSVVGVYQPPQNLFYLSVVLPNGTNVTSDIVYFHSHIIVTRSAQSVSISNGIEEMTIDGIGGLGDIEFSQICIGGGSFEFPGPDSGILTGLFVNGQHLLGPDIMYERMEISSTTAKFSPLGSVITLPNHCTSENIADIQFTFQTFDPDGELLRIAESSGMDFVLQLTDGKIKATVGILEIPTDGEIPSFNDGKPHFVLLGYFGAIVFVNTDQVQIFTPFQGNFCPSNSSMTLGGDFVGCISGLSLMRTPLIDFTEFAGNGVANVPCTDGCKSGPCGMHGECKALSETDFTCNCTDSYAGKVCDIAPSTTSTAVDMMSPSPSSQSPSPSSSRTTSAPSSPTHSTSSTSMTSQSSTAVLPTGNPPTNPETSALSIADIIGIVVGFLILICIIALVVVIILLACMLVANRRGFYKTKESQLNESNILRHNASLRSFSSVKPLHSSPKKEAEYYI
jgi:hypothetical protein